MRKKLPPLNALRAFERAARYQTFTEAAEALHVTPSAISRHVTQLEQWLGVALFVRRQRSMELTAEGRQFAQATSAAFDSLEMAARQLQTGATPELRFRLFPTIAFRWLVPAMIDFQKDWPSVDMQISTSMEPVDLQLGEVDLTVVICKEPPKDVRWTFLFPEELVPVCRPDYLPKGWDPDVRSSTITLLASQVRPKDWATWFQGANVKRPRAVRTLNYQYSFLAYEAAREGGGIAMAIKALVEDDLASGRLKVAHPCVVPTNSNYLLASAPQGRKKYVDAFHKWAERYSAQRQP